MKLFGALSMMWLGVQSVHGGPLVVEQDAQDSVTAPANQPQNDVVPTAHKEMGLGQVGLETLGWAVAAVGIPAAWIYRGRKVKGEMDQLKQQMGGLRSEAQQAPILRQQLLETQRAKFGVDLELERVRAELDEANSQGRPPGSTIIKVENVGSVTLEEYQAYLADVSACRTARLQLMGILKGSDRQKVLKHVDVNKVDAQFSQKVLDECIHDVSAFFREGRPARGGRQSPVWEEAHEKARSYRPPPRVARVKKRKGKGKGETEGDEKNAFSLNSAKEVWSNLPQTVSQIPSNIKQGSPNAWKYVTAGIASNSRIALQNARKAPKMAGVP
ncbi:MAG: hypothetical protein M1823_001793 [Watsoniomyces obsoletus]|nr:MAG: hypothetical protein M1823_001793 [Watsoniomyces obsoletus]